MKRFPSIKKNEDFRKVYAAGKSRSDGMLVIYLMKNNLTHNRIGISVSKKIGNSIVRHHVTRLIRESFRLHDEEVSPGYDIVAVARNPAAKAKYGEIENSYLGLLYRHRIMIQKEPGKNEKVSD